MSSDSEHTSPNDPTTPMNEVPRPGPTEEMPLPDWARPTASAGGSPSPSTGDLGDIAAPGPTFDASYASGSPPPPPPAPVPAPTRSASPVDLSAGFAVAPPPPPASSPAPGPVMPRSSTTSSGPTGPNFSTEPIRPASGEPVTIEPSRRSFAPITPPNPPDGPGRKPALKAKLSRWGWRSLVAFVAGGLVAAAGFAAGEINDSDSQVASPTPTSIVVQRQSDPAGDLVVDVDEPASLVAQVLGPSVVQINTGIGLGSGVIYRDGYILTNNHVVDGATELKVRLSTGENFQAELVGTDESKDLAVLSVGERDLPVADLALDGEVQVGQIAVAIGSPFELQQTVTAGIVSAVDRPIPSRSPGVYVAMIQTDAPINPGNSGGALADKNGRVIGINTAIQTDGFSATNAGVGFAIPIDDAVRIADLLVAGQPIEPGFLGVTGDEPDGGEAGVKIVEVTAGSAAEEAGLQAGDRVLSLDGAPVTSIQELAGLVLAHQAGDEVTLQVVRGSQEIDIEAVLGVRE